MTTEELKQFLEQEGDNEEVKNLLKDYAPKPKLEDLLSSEDYSSKLNSLLDSEKSKAVEAFKEKTLPKRVQEELEKKLKEKDRKDPWQIKLEEMEQKQQDLMQQLEQKERAEQREKLRNTAMKNLHSKELPDDLVDYFIGEDEDTTVENLNKFEETLSKYTKKIKEGVYKNKNTDVPHKESGSSTSGEPAPDAPKEEWKKYLQSKR